jgi:hypothetical protein
MEIDQMDNIPERFKGVESLAFCRVSGSDSRKRKDERWSFVDHAESKSRDHKQWTAIAKPTGC